MFENLYSTLQIGLPQNITVDFVLTLLSKNWRGIHNYNRVWRTAGGARNGTQMTFEQPAFTNNITANCEQRQTTYINRASAGKRKKMKLVRMSQLNLT